jgi:hypothetical protein
MVDPVPSPSCIPSSTSSSAAMAAARLRSSRSGRRCTSCRPSTPGLQQGGQLAQAFEDQIGLLGAVGEVLELPPGAAAQPAGPPAARGRGSAHRCRSGRRRRAAGPPRCASSSRTWSKKAGSGFRRRAPPTSRSRGGAGERCSWPVAPCRLVAGDHHVEARGRELLEARAHVGVEVLLAEPAVAALVLGLELAPLEVRREVGEHRIGTARPARSRRRAPQRRSGATPR